MDFRAPLLFLTFLFGLEGAQHALDRLLWEGNVHCNGTAIPAHVHALAKEGHDLHVLGYSNASNGNIFFLIRTLQAGLEPYLFIRTSCSQVTSKLGMGAACQSDIFEGHAISNNTLFNGSPDSGIALFTSFDMCDPDPRNGNYIPVPGSTWTNSQKTYHY